MARHLQIDEVDEDARISCTDWVDAIAGDLIRERTWRDTVADAIETAGAGMTRAAFGLADWVRR